MYLKLYDLKLASALLILGFVFIYLEIIASVDYLAICSFLLIPLFVFFYRFGDMSGLASPFIIYSVMYMGYTVGGVYYSQTDAYFGKFLEFMSYDRGYVEEMLVVAMLYSVLCYFFFSLGYCLISKSTSEFVVSSDTKFSKFFISLYRPLTIFLLGIGFFYWIWVCNLLAGGVVNAFVLFQVFPHLVDEHKISTLPYLLYYAGVYVFLIGLLLERSKIGVVFWLLSILGFMISISTARISLSVTYLFAQLYLIYLVDRRKRVFIIRCICLVVILAFVVFFLRELSNYHYIEKSIEFSLPSMLDSIVGGGNVTDLQQLVIILGSFEISDAQLGITYFDWLRNTFGVFFGMDPSSVGLLIAERYVPETSGAPTPGAIGEAYVNFGYGAPIFMFFVGFSFSSIKNISSRSTNILVHFTYSCFVVNFVFLYPKVDSTMMSNFFWAAFPTLSLFLMLYFLYLIRIAMASSRGLVKIES